MSASLMAELQVTEERPRDHMPKLAHRVTPSASQQRELTSADG